MLTNVLNSLYNKPIVKGLLLLRWELNNEIVIPLNRTLVNEINANRNN